LSAYCRDVKPRGLCGLEAKLFGLGLGLVVPGLGLGLGLVASGLGLIEVGLVASKFRPYSIEMNYARIAF